MLRPFARAGYRLFPLRGKQPVAEGWQTKSYTFPEIGGWMKRGFNVGVALGPDDLVADIDPRNFEGDVDSYRRLCSDLGVDLCSAPTVFSGRGDGGRHLYFKRPVALKLRGKLPGYNGIDFRSLGTFVVGPGSRHPDTSGTYYVDEFAPSISDVKPAPGALLEMLARPDAVDLLDGSRVGKFSNEQLAQFLAVLDPHRYGAGHHDAWFRLMAGAHDGTAGGGLAEFLAWCARDSRYDNERDQGMTARRWASLTAGEPGGADYRTVLKAVVDAGHPELVAAFDDDDAVEEDFLIYEIDEETDNG
jgi:hypothetical protein